MKKLRPIYYDTETTGVKVDKDRIIEIAAFDPFLDRSFSCLINPGIPIPKEASAIHKITDDMVKDAPSFKDVAKDFCSFCEGNVVLIAHNNDSFDQPFLEYEFKRHNVTFPDWKWLDSLKWARKYRPDLPRHALQVLREYFGFKANNAHRALDDVIILHKVFNMMIDDLELETVYELMSQKPQAIRLMPFGKHAGKPLKEVPASYVSWLSQQGAFDKPDNGLLKESFAKLGYL
ncbi:MAG: DUF3820 family protein [Simkaniaceae bacterium]